jgi:hypothetical protein
MKRYSLLLVVILATALSTPALAQFTDEEIAQRDAREDFLASAEIVSSEQMGQSEGVTLPWVLQLRGGGFESKAVWKNVEGRKGGFWECWKCEVAAYRLDKYLGLNAVPPAIVRDFKGSGALILWADHWIDGRKKLEDKIPVAGPRISHWNQMTALQRAFDNLIANEDRHLGNVLITEDWRIILIDHTRAFRSNKKSMKKLEFGDDKPMKRLPRSFVERIEALDEATLREVVGDTLTDAEITAVLARRVLLLKEIEKQGTYLYD